MARVEADSHAQGIQMQADLEAQEAQQAAAWAELRRHLETTVAPDEHERERQQDEIDELRVHSPGPVRWPEHTMIATWGGPSVA